jgi:hypothetical protein
VSTKTLLVILVVIAIVVGVAIWRGQRDEGEATSKENREKPPGEDFFLFKWLQGDGDTLAIARLVGCTRSGRNLTFTGTCNARLLAGKARQSRFELKPASVGPIYACYGFSMEQVDSCQSKDQKGRLKPDEHNRFVATKDEAFLRLYCLQSTGVCAVIVE